MNLLDVTSSTWTITLIGWGIVFVALVVLVIIFTYVPKIHAFFTNRKLRMQDKTEVNETLSDSIGGEEKAAIAMALHMFLNEQHDEESGVMTIKSIQQSPWSSKIFGLNNQRF